MVLLKSAVKLFGGVYHTLSIFIGNKVEYCLWVYIFFLLLQPASEEAKGFKKLPLGYWKEGNKRKRLIINDLRKTQKNFQIKFWKAEKFPTFATRYER